ncbi:hypothetical protein [Candidatus Methylobacter favarea]|uniref:hypothetical protein n=1 Tax=Candidatus Methylobacter favarea TaxID=2707345 RepID=UPI00157C3A20|nr:hypothetical protein [Candidatus Methylobacter favarea]
MILFTHRKAALGLILAVIALALVMIDTVFDLVLELLHMSFELIELSLDILIEYIFHTDLHDTQVIVFYLMWAIAGYPLYKLYQLLRSLPHRCVECMDNLARAWRQLKKQISAYWHGLSALGKAKWSMGFMTSVTCMIFWVLI